MEPQGLPPTPPQSQTSSDSSGAWHDRLKDICTEEPISGFSFGDDHFDIGADGKPVRRK